MPGNERLLNLDNLVETDVGVEVGLDVAEGDDGAVCTVTTAMTVRRYIIAHIAAAYPNLPSASRAGEKATASWKVLRTVVRKGYRGSH